LILLEINQKAYSSKDSNGNYEELNLPEEFKKELYQYFSTSNELLRHFWSCYKSPFTAPTVSQKATRIIGSISSLYDKIRQFSNSLPPDKRNLSQLLFPIIQSLDKAIEKHSNANAKKTT